MEKSLVVAVCEDHPINRLVITQLTESLGHQVHATEGGPELLAKIQSGLAVDLILLDCHMPEMDGYETARRLRKLEAEATCSFRIIALTADSLPGTREKCLAAGMDEYLTKPIFRQDLDAVISKVLGFGEPVSEPGALELLDLKIVQALNQHGMDSDRLSALDLAETFAKRAKELVIAQGQAWRRRDFGDIARYSKTLADLGQPFGIKAMVDLCREIHEAAQFREIRMVPSLLAQLEKTLEPSLACLRKELDSL